MGGIDQMGNTEEPEVLVGAVIHRDSFNRAKSYIDYAKSDASHNVLFGGKCDDSVGYFIQPTLIETSDPVNSKPFNEEIFAPIFTVYVYDDNKLDEALDLCENHPYGNLVILFIPSL
jgi:1-pyrroline-5-carboxylate dehydrogenase